METGQHQVATRHCPSKPWREWTYADIGAGEKDVKTVVVVRYGAFGDMIWLSSILPALKAEGYHITVSTTPTGADIIRSDPHVDALLIQESHQVPNLDLREFWQWLAGGYDRYIQLSESIEANLLAIGPRYHTDEQGRRHYVPGQAMFDWDHDKRHALLNKNYIEETHRIAGVPFDKPRTKFYPTVREKRAARARLEKFKQRRGLNKVVMIVLSGSSVHKAYPWMDNVIANILHWTEDHGVILVGDGVCRMLEDAWRLERRVMRRAGKGSIRQTMALAQLCDCVVGPETGVMNAVSMEPMQKILFLSHSSVENACRDWVNTKAVVSQVPCYPCHKIHHTRETCNIDPETHAAMCQVGIPPRLIAGYILGLPYKPQSRIVTGGGRGG